MHKRLHQISLLAAGIQYWLQEYIIGCRNTVLAAGIQYWLQEYSIGRMNTVLAAGIQYWLQEYSIGCRNTVLAAGIQYWPQEYSIGCRNTVLAAGIQHWRSKLISQSHSNEKSFAPENNTNKKYNWSIEEDKSGKCFALDNLCESLLWS